jgi:hypothetical protein
MAIPLEEFMARSLANPELRGEYEALAGEFDALAESLRAKQARAPESPTSSIVVKAHPDLSP